MGKKIRCRLMYGALLEPFFQFINRMEVGINPVSDPKGTKIAEYFYKFANTTRPIFRGQKFQSSLAYDFTSNSSWIVFHFLNGMKQGYHLKNINMQDFQFKQDLINKVVEFQRACEGHEDEYEDEVRK